MIHDLPSPKLKSVSGGKILYSNLYGPFGERFYPTKAPNIIMYSLTFLQDCFKETVNEACPCSSSIDLTYSQVTDSDFEDTNENSPDKKVYAYAGRREIQNPDGYTDRRIIDLSYPNTNWDESVVEQFQMTEPYYVNTVTAPVTVGVERDEAPAQHTRTN